MIINHISLALNKSAVILSKIVDPLSRIVNSVGAAVLALMMFFTTLDVALRYFFNKPIQGSFELTEYMMSIVISFGLAYCAIFKGHVRVDLFISRFSDRAQTVIDTITSLVTSCTFALVSWQCLEEAIILKATKLTSPTLFIPTFPFVVLLAFGCLLICLVFLIDFLNYLSKALIK